MREGAKKHAEIWKGISKWHEYLAEIMARWEPPKRMYNRHEARAAPKRIKAWRNEWDRLKAKDARRYRGGNAE